jgi:hypothetical protein
MQEASMFALWRHKHTDTRCCSRNLWSQLGIFLSPQTSLPIKFVTFNAESSHFTSEICCRAVWYCLHTSYTGYMRGNLPYFGRSFLRLNDVDVTKKCLYSKLDYYGDIDARKNVVFLRFHVLCMFSMKLYLCIAQVRPCADSEAERYGSACVAWILAKSQEDV